MKEAKIFQLNFYLLGFFLCNILNGSECCSTTVPKLKASALLFRHGDKSPEYTYPLDPHKDYPWLGGFGALSAEGAMQLFQSGLVKSLRYASLLSLKCLPNEFCRFDVTRISVLSSGSQRCIDSALNFLNGFLRVNWTYDLIEAIPKQDDEMLAIEGKYCAKYSFDEMLENYPFTSPVFSNVIDFNSQEGQDLLEFVRNNSGLPIPDILTLGYLEDALLIEHMNGLLLPEWADLVWQPYLHPLSEIFFHILGTLDYMRIRSGVLLKSIIDKLTAFSEGSSSQNILLYSGHDITLASFIHALNFKELIGIRPSYGASLAFELYENDAIENDLELKIYFFRDFADTTPLQINMNGCRAPCRFKRFIQLHKSVLISNFDDTCML